MRIFGNILKPFGYTENRKIYSTFRAAYVGLKYLINAQLYDFLIDYSLYLQINAVVASSNAHMIDARHFTYVIDMR